MRLRHLGFPVVVAAVLAMSGVVVPAVATTPAVVSDMTVVSWNICGEAGGSRGAEGFCPYRATVDQNMVKVGKIKEVIDQQNADAIVLQEVCGGPDGLHEKQLRLLLGAGWDFDFAPAKRPDDYAEPLDSSRCRGVLAGGRLGNLIAVKGTIAARAFVNSLPPDPAGVSVQTLPVQCVSVTGRSTSVCNTHILPGSTDPRIGGQIQAVKQFVDDFAATNGTVRTVLGGDFNREAEAAAMAPLTSSFENCIDGYTHHGWSAANQHTWHEFDHIFTTRPAEGSAFSSCDVDRTRMDTTENEPTSGIETGYSDHAPVIARLGGHRVPGDMDGDGRPDMVAIDAAGKLRLYRGNGDGDVSDTPDVIGSGGWSGASVTHRGDWTGDGLEDIVARVGSELRVYPGRLNGHPGAPTPIGTGFASDAQVVSVGDVTGDGHPDLVVSTGNKLWLHANNWAARPAVTTPLEIGSGGWSPMTLTAPGDADHDGRPDLLVRDTGNGDLWLYRGQANGGFGGRTLYGNGYGTTNRPLIAGAADANLDGQVDMWTTTSAGTGTLQFYAGGTNSAGNPADGPQNMVGPSGWSTITAIS